MASRARPDSTQGLNRAYAQIRTSVKAGEASFACSLGGKPAGGYVFAATELVQSPMGALWDVKYLVGAIAPADKAAEAYAILARMAGSFAIDRTGWRASNRRPDNSTRRSPRPMPWSPSASRTMPAPPSRPART